MNIEEIDKAYGGETDTYEYEHGIHFTLIQRVKLLYFSLTRKKNC